jgi:hypothetical protein
MALLKNIYGLHQKYMITSQTEHVSENIIAVMCHIFLKNMQWYVDSVIVCTMRARESQFGKSFIVWYTKDVHFHPILWRLHVWLCSTHHHITVLFAQIQTDRLWSATCVWRQISNLIIVLWAIICKWCSWSCVCR